MTFTAQSFGAGVQSVAMLHMALQGMINRPDLVIFADTGSEPKDVYRVVDESHEICDRNSIEFVTVKRPVPLADAPFLEAQVRVPLFTTRLHGRWVSRVDPTLDDEEYDTAMPETVWEPPGKKGILFRTCTDKHKISPIRQHLRARGLKAAELWLGMTVNEITRVKASNVKWVTNRYPLVERDLRRSDCEAFLATNGIVAAKSACVFCPYRSATMWRAVKAVPEDWAAAIAYDESIRTIRPGILCFVHSSRTPLRDAVLAAEPGLFDDECMGVCAV